MVAGLSGQTGLSVRAATESAMTMLLTIGQGPAQTHCLAMEGGTARGWTST